jgi:hypothetical protein
LLVSDFASTLAAPDAPLAAEAVDAALPDAACTGVASAPAAATARSVSSIWLRRAGSLRTASAARACSGVSVTDDGLVTGLAAPEAALAANGSVLVRTLRTKRKRTRTILRMGEDEELG